MSAKLPIIMMNINIDISRTHAPVVADFVIMVPYYLKSRSLAETEANFEYYSIKTKIPDQFSIFSSFSILLILRYENTF